MCKHWTAFRHSVMKFDEGRRSEHKDCYGTFKRLVRNPEYSKSDNFKKLSVLAQILSFL